MASMIQSFFLIMLVVKGGEFVQFYKAGDNLWNFFKQVVDERVSTNKDDITVDDVTHQTAVKEKEKVYDVMAKRRNPTTENVNILMPGVTPTKMDTYLCTGYKLPESTTYLIGYQPAAEMEIAHHMLMFGCETLPSKKTFWNCIGDMGSPCGGGKQSIMYAWGRNAPPLKMDRDVGMKVGGDTGFKYLVLQVHYLNLPTTKDYSGVRVTFDTRKKEKLAGIFFLGAGGPPIPPHKKEFFMDMGCEYIEGPTFHPFRYRVHAHSLGRVISAYRVRNGVWTLIGRKDPLKPQAFYEVADKTIDVKPGDALMGRCTYNSEARNRTTFIGATHSDEMCNFYIMYYYDSTKPGIVDDGGCRTPKLDDFGGYPSDHTVV